MDVKSFASGLHPRGTGFDIPRHLLTSHGFRLKTGILRVLDGQNPFPLRVPLPTPFSTSLHPVLHPVGASSSFRDSWQPVNGGTMGVRRKMGIYLPGLN